MTEIIPLYKKLTSQLLEELHQNPPPSGSRFYSVRELVERYQVSFLTANKVLDELASEGVIYRKRGSGSFFRDPASGVRITYCGHKQFIMGVSYEEGMQKVFEDSFWDELRTKGHRVNFYDITEGTHWEIPQKLLKETDVILTLNGFITPEVDLYLRRIGKPVIVRGETYLGTWPFHQIVNSLVTSLDVFVRKFPGLLDKPMLILSTDYPDTMSRATSFMHEVELYTSHKATMNLQTLVLPANDSGRLCGYQYGLEHSEEIRGHFLFVTSDFIAAGLMEALDRKKLVAGKDYFLLGYDNLEDRGFTVFDHPRISSIGNDMKQYSEHLHRLIMRVVGTSDGTVYTCHIPTQLTIRESLGTTK